jgi:hypothetical protein
MAKKKASLLQKAKERNERRERFHDGATDARPRER